MHNASAAEHKRVFKKVIEESIKVQQKIIDKAKEIRAARAANGDGKMHIDS